MLLVGGAVLRISLTDAYLRYVKAGLRPFLIGAGILLVAAAVMTLWYQWRQDPAHSDTHPDGRDEHRPDHHRDDDRHGHSGEPRIAWLLLLPAFALLLIAPPALGADAASRAGTTLQQPTSDFPPLPAGEPAKLTMLDYASRAVFDQGRSIGARTVTLTGFVLTDANGQSYLVRMVLSCCAADARPIKVGLTGTVPSGLAADSWLEVTGRYTAKTDKDPINGASIPYIEVTEVRVVARPQEPYES
jgi:uncharacterized repeat protein (TIGR03943 family)